MALTTAFRDHLTRAAIGSSVTSFNNANAHLGVGGGAGATNAFAAAQTDLQGASKTRKAMDATFPTDPPSPANRMTFRSTFATGDANYQWDEWAVFNAAAAGTMMNRVVTNLGTKTSAASWQFTVTIDLSV
jgi:hypothetical protein